MTATMSSLRSVLALSRGIDAELLVDHEAADPGQVVAARVDEHAAEERARRLHGGRLARPQLAVDLDERLVGVLDVVAGQRLVHRGVDLARAEHQELERRHPRLMIWVSTVEVISVLVLDQHLAALGVDDAGGRAAAHQRLRAHRDLLDAGLDQLLDQLGGEQPCPP